MKQRSPLAPSSSARCSLRIPTIFPSDCPTPKVDRRKLTAPEPETGDARDLAERLSCRSIGAQDSYARRTLSWNSFSALTKNRQREEYEVDVAGPGNKGGSVEGSASKRKLAREQRTKVGEFPVSRDKEEDLEGGPRE